VREKHSSFTSLGATCHQLRAEAYDRFFKINTLVIFLNEDDSTSVNEVNLKRVRRITIEPYWRELPTIVLTHHATGWQVKESYETVEMNEWLSIVKDSNLEPTVRAVQAILEEGAGKGLTADCVKKVRMAQQSILANMGEGQSGSWSY
jgi:hypothetical protein